MAPLFAADDKFADVVAALEARGWRRLPVGCPLKCDLKWTNYAKVAWARVASDQFVNHLQHAVLFSQKDRLTELLYAHAVSQVDGQRRLDGCFPRTFDFSQPRDRQIARRWFLFSQAVALLKGSLEEGVDVDRAQLEAAEKLVKVILADEQFFECWREREDSGEWAKVLTTDSGVAATIDDQKKREVKGLLGMLQQRDAQFHAVGGGDGNVWICKPSNLSQGRGIVLCSSLREMLEITVPEGDRSGEVEDGRASSTAKWIVQKYIERPLLMQNGRKFDIRQWVLITELEPKPTAFWFDKSYLRFCARKFDLMRLEDRFTHLSNYSVQQHFVPDETANAGQTERDTATAGEREDKFEPMWLSEQFRDALRQEHGRDVWIETILPQMQSTARLVLDAVLPQLKVVGRGFEWLGFDFLVDENHRVWLLEVNVSPDVSHSTAVTAELAPKATADALNVVLDLETSRSPDNGWLPFSLE